MDNGLKASYSLGQLFEFFYATSFKGKYIW